MYVGLLIFLTLRTNMPTTSALQQAYVATSMRRQNQVCIPDTDSRPSAADARATFYKLPKQLLGAPATADQEDSFFAPVGHYDDMARFVCHPPDNQKQTLDKLVRLAKQQERNPVTGPIAPASAAKVPSFGVERALAWPNPTQAVEDLLDDPDSEAEDVAVPQAGSSGVMHPTDVTPSPRGLNERNAASSVQGSKTRHRRQSTAAPLKARNNAAPSVAALHGSSIIKIDMMPTPQERSKLSSAPTPPNRIARSLPIDTTGGESSGAAIDLTGLPSDGGNSGPNDRSGAVVVTSTLPRKGRLQTAIPRRTESIADRGGPSRGTTGGRQRMRVVTDETGYGIKLVPRSQEGNERSRSADDDDLVYRLYHELWPTTDLQGKVYSFCDGHVLNYIDHDPDLPTTGVKRPRSASTSNAMPADETTSVEGGNKGKSKGKSKGKGKIKRPRHGAHAARLTYTDSPNANNTFLAPPADSHEDGKASDADPHKDRIAPDASPYKDIIVSDADPQKDITALDADPIEDPPATPPHQREESIESIPVSGWFSTPPAASPATPRSDWHVDERMDVSMPSSEADMWAAVDAVSTPSSEADMWATVDANDGDIMEGIEGL